MTNVVKQVMGLKAKSIKDLQALWRDIFHTNPPPHPKAYLIPRLAYRLQELALGGLSESAQRKLEALAGHGRRSGKSSSSTTPLLKGTTLIREWQGEEYRVTVIEGGFDYQGQRYKSLSAIARKITGTQWNGPLFWGLRQSKKKVASALKNVLPKSD